MKYASLAVSLVAALAAPSLAADQKVKVGERVDRKGDEIVVCGQLFHTTAPVKLWTDPGGYDAYRTERRFSPLETSSFDATKTEVKDITSPNRFGMRKALLTPAEVEKVRGGGWDLPLLQEKVDQFVIHFDVCGTSQKCFQVLHDNRGLSVQFMLDIDGTIYQTLDLKERAWHATKANDRSIGIEIANIGTFQSTKEPLPSKWYARDEDGKTRLVISDPKSVPTLAPGSILRPMRNDVVTGVIQGQSYSQYDLTPQQYESLTKLTATLCKVFPKIKCDYPRDTKGLLIPNKLPDPDYNKYQGVLGHYHVQQNKNDPGPAFQWDLVIGGAKKLMAD